MKRPVTVIDGFPSYAPSLAFGGSGFDESFFDQLVRFEEQNFWFRARTDLIVDLIERFAPAAGNMLDAGCGTGIVLKALRARTRLRLAGAEPFIQGLKWARDRVPDGELIQSDVSSLPYSEQFDVAGAFDVIEHIQDDVDALAVLRRTIRPGGIVIVTVPQHPWLWSAADEIAHHCRRYRRSELAAKIERAGLRLRFTTSFVSLLLPAMLIARRFSGNGKAAELALPEPINRLFSAIMRIERTLIHAGVRFPAGGSLIAVAERSTEDVVR